MLTMIVGDNSVGKTLYLQNLMTKSRDKNYVTNLVDGLYKAIEFDYDVIDVICDELACDYVIADGLLVFQDSGVSLWLNKILTLLCKDCKDIYLDEPEKELSYDEIFILVRVLSCVYQVNRNIWVTTHESKLLTVTGVNILYVSDNGIFKAQRGDLIDKMDTVRG